GVIDVGNVFADHEDLHVVATLDARPVNALHATHVAGLACADGSNDKGLAGLGNGCPVVSVPVGKSDTFFTKVYDAMVQMTKRPDVKVVNISLGENAGGCATPDRAETFQSHASALAPLFRQLLAGPGAGILWTFSAGNNCAPGVNSPWGQNSDLDNVIVV